MPNITIGGTVHAVYDTKANADAYFKAASHGAPWAAASSSSRDQFLVTSTRVFERESWLGTPTLPIDKSDFASQPAGTQPLEWGRTGLTDKNDVAIPSGSIPQDVIDGYFEYALALLNDATVQTADPTGSNVKVSKSSQRVEGAITVSTETQFFNPTLGSSNPYPGIVMDLIGQFLEGASGIELSFTSGTDAVSAFADDADDFGFTDGGIP